MCPFGSQRSPEQEENDPYEAPDQQEVVTDDDRGHQSDHNSNSDHDDMPLDVVTKNYLCKIRGENRLTSKAVQNIAVATNHLMHQTITKLKRKVGEVLQGMETDDVDIQNIDSVFEEAVEEIEMLRSPLSQPFSIDGTHTIVSTMCLFSMSFLFFLSFFLSFFFFLSVFLPSFLPFILILVVVW